MKSRTPNSIVIAILAALAASMPLGAQSNLTTSSKTPHYSVTSLSTLGGTQGGATGINNKGWITGYANLPGDETEHPTVWRDGVIADLGTLGGPNGAAGFPFKNDRGLITGVAQTETPDPLGENWNFTCTFQGTLCNGTDFIPGGFVWIDGVKIPLATLGGNNANAATANNWGQVVGWAETSTVDTSCVAPQVLDFEAVIWNPRNHQIHELQPFPGDVVGAAVAINDLGQVVGASGNCAPVSPAVGAHAVLWQNGSVISLGSLGGAFTNVAYDINNRSQVVGVSDLPGDTTAHAFFWENGKMTDLGTLPGDFFSVAFAINVKGQVVGQSCDQNGNCRAFIWQNGVMTDLNALVSQSSSLYLYTANDINDLGEIVGQAVDPVTGNAPAFLATPTSADEYGEAATGQVGENAGTKVKVVLPEKVLKSLQQQNGFRRFGPQLIDMRGTGLVSGPNATLSLTSLTFGTQLIGTTSSAQSVTLINKGTTTLSITSIKLTGTDPGDFAQTNNCESSVPPGSSCTIRITFTPAQAGAATGALAVEDNAPGSPQKVSLSGTGTAVELAPSSLPFLCVISKNENCTAPALEDARLTNKGATDLDITSIKITGSNDFSETNNCDSRVTPGGSCTITVSFSSGGNLGKFYGDVVVTDSGGASPQLVALSGDVMRKSGAGTLAIRSALAAHGTAIAPAPTGLTRIGTSVMDLVDPTRVDPYLQDGSKRELLVRFWYPASIDMSCHPAEYTSAGVWNYFSELTKLPLPQVKTNSCLDVPVATGAHPVVVFTHGYTGTFTDYTFLFEDLASRGYVVASIDHTYEATAVEFPDGRLVKSMVGSHLANTWRTDDQTVSFALSVRLDDLKFVLNELERLNAAASSPFAGTLDLTKVALAGHSLGGLTTWRGVLQDPRFKAAILLEPYLSGTSLEPTEKPVLLLAAGRVQWSEEECQLWSDLLGPRFLVNLGGGEHLTPSDAVWLAKGAIKTGAMGPEKTIAAVRDYIAAFLDANLQGRLAPGLLNGPSSDYPDAVVTTQEHALCHEP